MKFPKYYIGPMSKNVVDCVIKHGRQHAVGFIPSRRQVDYCGGYVNGWTTQSFSNYVGKNDTPALICRDHGGEMQGKEPDDGFESFFEDCKYFDLIHVIPLEFQRLLEMQQKEQKKLLLNCGIETHM